MTTLATYLRSQFAHPRGPVGWLVGQAMRFKNDRRLAWAVAQLPLRPEARILELGCGPGAAIRKIVPRLTTGGLTAIDRSALMLRMAARANAAAVAAGTVHLVHGTYPDVRLPTAPFDLIFGVNVHLFWDDPVAVMKQIRSHLTPGGSMHLMLHPHWLPSNAHVHALGRRTTAQVTQAGFDTVDLQFEPMRPVDLLYVCGVRKKRLVSRSASLP